MRRKSDLFCLWLNLYWRHFYGLHWEVLFTTKSTLQCDYKFFMMNTKKYASAPLIMQFGWENVVRFINWHAKCVYLAELSNLSAINENIWKEFFMAMWNTGILIFIHTVLCSFLYVGYLLGFWLILYQFITNVEIELCSRWSISWVACIR